MEYFHRTISMILHFFILIISKVECFCLSETIFLERRIRDIQITSSSISFITIKMALVIVT